MSYLSSSIQALRFPLNIDNTAPSKDEDLVEDNEELSAAYVAVSLPSCLSLFSMLSKLVGAYFTFTLFRLKKSIWHVSINVINLRFNRFALRFSILTFSFTLFLSICPGC